MSSVAQAVDDLLGDLKRHELQKEAGLWNAFRGAFTGGALGSKAGEALVGGAALGAVGVLGAGLQEGYKAVKGKIDKSRGYRAMMEMNPGLEKMDAKKVQRTFNSLHGLNSDVAMNPLVAGGFVAKTMQYGDHETMGLGGGYIDVNTVRTLSDKKVPGMVSTQFMQGALRGTSDTELGRMRQGQAMTLASHKARIEGAERTRSALEGNRDKAKVDIAKKIYEHRYLPQGGVRGADAALMEESVASPTTQAAVYNKRGGVVSPATQGILSRPPPFRPPR